MRRWLVDTQLIADWCLWQLADETHQKRRVERAADGLPVLTDRGALDALKRELAKATVVVATNVLVEVSGVLWRRLRHGHRGDTDRLNEKILRTTFRFADRYNTEVVAVTEEEAEEELKEMNRKTPPKPFDLGDAALLAVLKRKDADCSLLTSDSGLVDHCFNVGRPNVFRFVQGRILDAKGNPFREDHAKRIT